MDLGDSGAPVVDPYTYGPAGDEQEMSQYNAGDNNYPTIPSGPSRVGGEDLAAVGLAGVGAGAAAAAGAPRRGPSSASTLTSAGFAGRGAGNYNPNGFDAYGTPLPMPVPGSSQESNGSQPSSAATRKMREAQQERQRAEGGVGGIGGGETSGGMTSPTDTTHTGTASDVVVHSDGGRYIPDEELGAQLQPEVPPT